MDADRFDTVVKTLTTVRSRRGLTRLLGGLTFGSLLTALGEAGLGRAPVKAATDRTCKGKRPVNNEHCHFNECQGDGLFCACGETVQGDKRCVDFYRKCPKYDECNRDSDCHHGRGFVCVKMGACCGHRRWNACANLCT